MAAVVQDWSLLCAHGTPEARTCNATVNESIERSLHILHVFMT